jgi:hypothetical protein
MKKRHIRWDRVIWALSQIIPVWLFGKLIVELVRIARSVDYEPADKTVVVCSIGLMVYTVINLVTASTVDPIDYVRAWWFIHRNPDAVDPDNEIVRMVRGR